MKSITKALIFLCILCALFAITATATSNDKLPSKEEVTNFVTETKGSTASDILDKVKDDHPSWYVDLIECSTCSGSKDAIALYYTDSNPKGFSSIYIKDGQIVSPATLKGYSTKESYKGTIGDSKEDESDKETCKDGSCKEEVSESKDVSIKSESNLSVEERKEAFMEFLKTKDSVTLKEVQDELDKCFPDDMEV
ncbi:MAG: hypothetical protein ABFD07_19120 [Methanobacterium sp.]